jgi:anaerobic magnesium-protoporphyrin IX monomethyl ester cyclase
MTVADIVSRVVADSPDLVLIGHSGSTSAHPTARVIAEAIKSSDPKISIIYGGVFPTYHWRGGAGRDRGIRRPRARRG